MPRTIEVQLYKFDELSDKAKETARQWWRDLESADFGGHGELWEPAQTAAQILGITFDDRAVPLHGGGTRIEPKIWYSGFWSQGDGASWEGRYEYAKGCAKKIRAEFGDDPKLYAIADELTAIQKANGYRLTARVKTSGQEVHDGAMDIEVFKGDDEIFTGWENRTGRRLEGTDTEVRDRYGALPAGFTRDWKPSTTTA